MYIISLHNGLVATDYSVMSDRNFNTLLSKNGEWRILSNRVYVKLLSRLENTVFAFPIEKKSFFFWFTYTASYGTQGMVIPLPFSNGRFSTHRNSHLPNTLLYHVLPPWNYVCWQMNLPHITMHTNNILQT